MSRAWIAAAEAALDGYPLPDGFAFVQDESILHWAPAVDDSGHQNMVWIAYIAETNRPDPIIGSLSLKPGITGGEVRDRVGVTVDAIRKEREKRDSEKS